MSILVISKITTLVYVVNRLLSEEARSRIKSRCLSLLDEEDDMVSA